MDQHWLYPPTQQTWTPSRGLKRGISESDVMSDDGSSLSSKEHTSPGSDTCQLVSRKKRRGVIEKKRRDKINNSLVELKRLVPSCFEKQGSSKLEKAEILQLTVDHLKTLHAKGNDSYSSYDHQRFALEYHITGFRECISEVARYLATIEGLDLQNPLRLRLMSHLQCFMAQRELSARSNAGNSYAACAPPAPAPASSSLYQQSYPTQNHLPMTSMPQNPHTSIPRTISHETESSQVTSTNNSYNNNKSIEQDPGQISPSSTQQIHAYGHPESHHIEHHHGSTYIELTNSRNSFQPYTAYPGEHPAYGNNATYNNSSKPYRPWGAEMAY